MLHSIWLSSGSFLLCPHKTSEHIKWIVITFKIVQNKPLNQNVLVRLQNRYNYFRQMPNVQKYSKQFDRVVWPKVNEFWINKADNKRRWVIIYEYLLTNDDLEYTGHFWLGASRCWSKDEQNRRVKILFLLSSAAVCSHCTLQDCRAIFRLWPPHSDNCQVIPTLYQAYKKCYVWW